MKETLNSKKGLLVWGGLLGAVAVWLAIMGNPGNMAFCIACFIRDIAGAAKLHTAPIVQYMRPEIAGLIAGAFIISMATGEYRSTAGSSPMIRFLLGIITMIGALVFLGCPLRMVIRMAAGDLNAYMGLIGFVLGVGTGCIFLKKGFSLGTAHLIRKRKRLHTSCHFPGSSGFKHCYASFCSKYGSGPEAFMLPSSYPWQPV